MKPLGKSVLVRMVVPSLIAMATALPTPAQAQAWPNKPILIAQAPGSATDVVSRIVGIRLGENLGQPIAIEARPGTGGALGTEQAARFAPDGDAPPSLHIERVGHPWTDVS